MKAIWNGAIIAESEHTKVMDGNHYFPPESLQKEFLDLSDTQTVCGSKGIASYYTVIVNGKQNPDAAWSYPKPTEEAAQIRNHMAFWRGVDVIE